MTDQEILTAAVSKAIANGWKWQYFQGGYFPTYLSDEHLVRHIAETMNDLRLNALVYSHAFAKALWGGAENERGLPSPDFRTGDTFVPALYEGPSYKYHLMMMVIADNPIKYLGENL